LNNIPSLIFALGGSAGLAGVISVVAVGASVLWTKFSGGAQKAKEDTGDLFTAAGAFIKNVHCPKGAAAVGLLGVAGRGRLSCHGCSRRIHDVRLKTEAHVVALVKADPKACLLLDRRNLSLS
jgi:hypothetical protein